MSDVPQDDGWWLASDGLYYPPTQPVPPMPPPVPAVPVPTAGEPVLLTLGDIGISANSVVTPNGSAPLRGSQWVVRDMTRTDTHIPPVAIVLAIIFFFACLLGLLFLLMKEQTTSGYVEVSVTSGQLHHVCQVPVSNPSQVAFIRQQVHQAQSMAAAA